MPAWRETAFFDDRPAAPAPDVTTDQFLKHRPTLYGLAYRLLGSVHDAQDVLQEASRRPAGREEKSCSTTSSA
jgi:DNA-directed RNA polymerase specialized sigma24 family protein